MPMTLHAGEALLDGGWRQNVRLLIQDGVIAEVKHGVAPEAGDERHALLVPAMANLHSHAFQRGMAGLAEMRGPGTDSFWSWRETMYRYALAMTPDEVEAIAAQLYVEMLEAGFCHVGEFHYLHHDLDGRPYADIGEMAKAIVAAAVISGISLTLLPVFYAHSTFGGAAPGDAQRRFVNDLDGFARLVESAGDAIRGLENGVLGVAAHSLRAVTPDELTIVAKLRPHAPIHIHAAEQTREVEDCLAWSGKRPVEWLLADQTLDGRWCLIHATHMTPAEVTGVAATGAVVGLCPVTEANLGDGVFAGPAFMNAGGRLGVGSDSNVLIGVADELRQLEYAQRLHHHARNVMAKPHRSTGRILFEAGLAGGAQAVGQPGKPHIAKGAPANLVSLDPGHPALVGRSGDSVLDSWIFAASRPAVDAVWVAGRKQVEKGRHQRREEIGRRFAAAVLALSARL